MFCYSCDLDSKKVGSINGYARLWGWSRGKVRRFLERITEKTKRTPGGHPNGHPIRLIHNDLQVKTDTPTDTQRYTTIDPNPSTSNKRKPKNIEEVVEFLKEKRIKNPEKSAEIFVNHYELKNWTYGKTKTPIKNWHLCVAQFNFEKEHLPL